MTGRSVFAGSAWLAVAGIARAGGDDASGNRGDKEDGEHDRCLVAKHEERPPVRRNLAVGCVSERLPNARDMED